MKPDQGCSWQLRLLARARSQTPGIFLLVALWLVQTGLALLKPWPLKIIVDYVLPNRALPGWLAWLRTMPGSASQGSLLLWLTASTLMVFLLGWGSTVAGNYIRINVGGRLTYGFAAEVFAHLQRLSLRFHNGWATGDLVKRVAVDCRCVQDLVVDVYLPVVTSVATLTLMFAWIWAIDIGIAVVALMVVPIMAATIVKLLSPMTQREYEMSTAEGMLMAKAEQSFSAIPIIQAFGVEAVTAKQFRQSAMEVGTAYLKKIWAGSVFKIVVNATIAGGTATVMVLGGYHVIEHRIQLGDLIIVFSYLEQMYAPLAALAYVSTSYTSAAASARRVFDVIATDDTVVDRPDARTLQLKPNAGIRVELRDVSFSYQRDKEVLHHVTLAAEAGSTVALVGPSGAGKTTVVSLILRLFDPEHGQVLFDGVDVRAIRLSSLRENVSIVLQEPFLMPMTIAENIAYGRPHAPREEIIAAAKAAHAHEFIEELPEGYDSMVGERGANLSGGQRQRLSIARAFLKNAPVLILDEPTSALDARSEAAILDAMKQLLQGRTTFIIAHRLTTIRNASHIVVLRAGEVVETGTHDELASRTGLYAELSRAHTRTQAQLS